jgi:predicted O-methyltransferase YrrM
MRPIDRTGENESVRLMGVKDKIKSINYMLTEEEVKTLFKYASLVEGIIVDIGTAFGGSAFVMALSSPKSKVVTIDPFKNDVFFFYREQWGLVNRLDFLEITSDKAVDKFEDNSIDLLFIDGIHNYWGVMNDFNAYQPKLTKDSIVIFHDYYLYDDTIGKAVDELVESGKIEKLEIIDSLFKGDKRTGMFVSKVC